MKEMTEKEKNTNNSHNVDNKNFKYYLGLDLGISSVGWAVMAEEINTGEHYLHDFGVRIFDIAENRDGKSLAQERRGFRSQRRLIRRRVYRIKKLKYLLKNNFLSEEEFYQNTKNIKTTNKIMEKDGNFETENGYWNHFVLRCKGLKAKLSKEEIYTILIHFAKKRGYLDKSLMEEQEETKNKKLNSFQTAIKKGENWTNKKTIAEIVLNDPEFKIKESKNFLIYTKNGKYSPLKKDENNDKPDNKKPEINYRVLFSRDAYQKELNKILAKQEEYYPELTKIKNDIFNTIFQNRDFEAGPKCKTHKDKCIRNACSKYKTFMELVGNCPFYPKEKRGYKSSLIFDVYYFVTEISKFLIFLQKTGMKFSPQIYQEMIKKWIEEDSFNKKAIKKYLKTTTEWKNKGSDSYFQMPFWIKKGEGIELGKGLFLKEIKKTTNLRKLLFMNKNPNSNDYLFQIENNILNKLGKILSKNITRSRRKEKINSFINENNLTSWEKWKPEDKKIIKNMKSTITSPAKVSDKYMLLVIKNFLEGKIYTKEVVSDNLYERKIVIDHGKKIFSKLTDWDLVKNPVVFRAVNQTRKVLKALYDQYKNFENISLETARELAKNLKDRKKIQNSNMNNARNNEKIIKELEERNIIVNFSNIQAYRLWKEQKEMCLYCSEKIINFSPAAGSVQIDHIIPFSKLADDSYANKVLVCSKCNQEKGNRTPLQWMEDTNNLQMKKSFLTNIETIKKGSYKKYNYLKAKKVDSEEFEDFVSRNINDTRYITKYLLGYIKKQIKIFEKKKKNSSKNTSVLAVVGEITSKLRRDYFQGSPWGLATKVRDITPFHHAFDAAIVAQFKGQYEVELAIDLARISNQQQKIKRIKNEKWKEWQKTSLKNYQNAIKEKWARRNKSEFSNLIEKEIISKPIYIKNLKTELENRIPVKLVKEDCLGKNEIRKCNDTTGNFNNCGYCKGSGYVPKFLDLLNEEEWSQYQKKENHLAKKINLRYPLISYMTQYKISGAWASSQEFGFKEDLKNLYYKIWRKDPQLLLEKHKNKIKNQEKWKEWKDQFKKKEGFIFDEKTGNIMPTDKYYGMSLKENKGIRKLDLIQKIRKKEKFILIPKEILVKGVNIEYFDKKLNKKIIKNFRSKMGESICIHPNNLSFFGSHKKNKNIFGNKSNYYDNLNNIIEKNHQIWNIDILGNKTKIK